MNFLILYVLLMVKFKLIYLNICKLHFSYFSYFSNNLYIFAFFFNILKTYFNIFRYFQHF